jgi:hypothetical protein
MISWKVPDHPKTNHEIVDTGIRSGVSNYPVREELKCSAFTINSSSWMRIDKSQS